jgi:hypothetical protein
VSKTEIKCQCGAYNSSECGCPGVDWRSEREKLLEARCAALEARDQILRSLMANLPDKIHVGSNGSWIGVSDDRGERYYPHTMGENERQWFDLFILRGMLGVVLKARALLKEAPHPDAINGRVG